MDKQQQKTVAIVVGSFVLLVILWMAMSAYASKQAENKLNEKLQELGMQDAVGWSSIKSSPLGGKTVIKDLNIDYVLDLGVMSFGYEMNALKVVLNNFNSEAQIIKDASFELYGVEIPPELKSGKRNGLAKFHTNILMKGALQSGISDLPPFDLNLAWEIDDNEAELGFVVIQPEMADIEVDAVLNGNFKPLIEQVAKNPNRVANLAGLQAGLDRSTTLEFLDIKLKDDGFVKRSHDLSKRYALANANPEDEIDIEKGVINLCENEFKQYLSNKNGCDPVSEFITADNDELQLTSEFPSPISSAVIVNSINGKTSSNFKFSAH